jgi:hypothetical protein
MTAPAVLEIMLTLSTLFTRRRITSFRLKPLSQVTIGGDEIARADPFSFIGVFPRGGHRIVDTVGGLWLWCMCCYRGCPGPAGGNRLSLGRRRRCKVVWGWIIGAAQLKHRECCQHDEDGDYQEMKPCAKQYERTPVRVLSRQCA